MPKPFLSVIVPAYNEAKRLPLTLIDMDRHLSKAEYSYEILVVNDGSVDETAEIAKRFSQIIKNLKLIDNNENHGKGWAVRQGMLSARGNLRLFMDVDNSTSVDQFNNMIPYFKEGYDVVIGSRDIKGAKLILPPPWYKRMLGNVGNLIIRILLLRGFWDTQCGFKCFSEEAALRIFRLTKINRWAFDVEALVLAKLLGYRIKEIPVRWVNNPYSSVGFGSYFSFLWDVAKIWWRVKRKNKKLVSYDIN